MFTITWSSKSSPDMNIWKSVLRSWVLGTEEYSVFLLLQIGGGGLGGTCSHMYQERGAGEKTLQRALHILWEGWARLISYRMSGGPRKYERGRKNFSLEVHEGFYCLQGKVADLFWNLAVAGLEWNLKWKTEGTNWPAVFYKPVASAKPACRAIDNTKALLGNQARQQQYLPCFSVIHALACFLGMCQSIVGVLAIKAFPLATRLWHKPLYIVTSYWFYLAFMKPKKHYFLI